MSTMPTSSSTSAVISSLLLVAFVLLSMTVAPSHQQHPSGQYSWMPQGRFGKRTTKDEIGSAGVRQALLNVIRNSSSRKFAAELPKIDVDAASLQYADVPVIGSDTDGIVCLRTDYIGYYKCFRESKVSSAASSAVDVAVPGRERVVDELQ